MKVLKALLMATTMLFATSASAIFSAQLLMGQRTGEIESDSSSTDLNSSDVGFAFHLDPIPAIPVSFGAAFNMMSFDVSMEEQGIKEMSGYTITPQLRAWWPLGDVKPYARIGYALGGYTAKSEMSFSAAETGGEAQTIETDVVYTSAGMHFAVGVEYQPAPMLSLLLEYEMATDVLTAKEVKMSGGDSDTTQSVEDGAKSDWKNSAILFGVGFGI